MQTKFLDLTKPATNNTVQMLLLFDKRKAIWMKRLNEEVTFRKKKLFKCLPTRVKPIHDITCTSYNCMRISANHSQSYINKNPSK